MKIVVIGAGVIGVTSAWYLARDGHAVTVLDRQPGPALETSYANGGQISVSHAEPWANPSAPARILGWLGREDAPLLWRLRADSAQWAWGLRFIGQCRNPQTLANMRALVALGLYSRQMLAALRSELGLAYQQQLRGILHIYTDCREYARAQMQAARMREYGCDRHPVSADECIAIEPALAHSRVRLCGGTFTAADESGDAHAFAVSLADHCGKAGVVFRYGEHVARVLARQGRIQGLGLLGGEVLEADAFVMAAGSYSGTLLRSVGVRIPVYPAKGYSVTFSGAQTGALPSVSLTDDQCKLVFSRLDDRLRVAGTAEFSGYDTSINDARCRAIVQRSEQFFPNLSACSGMAYWAGLRPATPGNVPLVGKAGHENLWLNTGHGTLGWTLACGSAALLTDLVAGRSPAVVAQPYRPS